MSFSIAQPDAVERLRICDFFYRNSVSLDDLHYVEFQREAPGFLQRIIAYSKSSPQDGVLSVEYAVLRTKCAPKAKMVTVYDVEYLLCRGPACLTTLVEMAQAHWEQYQTSGASSFFREPDRATPHYDQRTPVEVGLATAW